MAITIGLHPIDDGSIPSGTTKRIKKMQNVKIFGEEIIDPKAINQFYNALNEEWVIQGALMPDSHLGYSLPIGGVVSTQCMVVPAWVGYDIGCGVCAIPTTLNINQVMECNEDIFAGIYDVIPVGFKHNDRVVRWDLFDNVLKTPFLHEMFRDKGGLKQLGTLGGGNHFIEIGYDEHSQVWIIIHSGSRNVGHSVATHYMKMASGTNKAKEGNYAFGTLTNEGKQYIMDMKFCLKFALENRVIMLKRIGKVMDSLNIEGELLWNELINRTHNHAEIKDDGTVIHRKGATHAEKDMYGVIPGNMRDGSYIVRGLGNTESMNSSSHGGGRLFSRKKAKTELSFDTFQDDMESRKIVAKVSKGTLDESAGAYKDIKTVMDYQSDLVEITHRIKPIINVKG